MGLEEIYLLEWLGICRSGLLLLHDAHQLLDLLLLLLHDGVQVRGQLARGGIMTAFW